MKDLIMHKLGFISKESFRNKTLKKEILGGDTIASAGPDYAVIDITNRCNFKCIACWTYSPLLADKMPAKEWFGHELPFRVISDLVSDLSSMGTREIRLTGGGEPFMHPDILKIIKLVKDNNIRLDITTNFSLLNKEKLDYMIGLGVDNLTISLWASDSETYMKTHPGQPELTFRKIEDNITYLCRAKKKTKVVISNVISNLNYQRVDEMVQFCLDKGADEVYFTLVDPIAGATDRLLLDRSQLQELSESFREVISRYKKGKYNGLRIDNPENFLRRIQSSSSGIGNYDSDMVFKIPCTIGWTFTRIMANGDVAPCCRAVMIPSGNILKSRFREIWNSRQQRRFRQIGMKLNEHPAFTEKIGCMKTCDNLMQNKETWVKISTK